MHSKQAARWITDHHLIKTVRLSGVREGTRSLARTCITHAGSRVTGCKWQPRIWSTFIFPLNVERFPRKRLFLVHSLQLADAKRRTATPKCTQTSGGNSSPASDVVSWTVAAFAREHRGEPGKWQLGLFYDANKTNATHVDPSSAHVKVSDLLTKPLVGSEIHVWNVRHWHIHVKCDATCGVMVRRWRCRWFRCLMFAFIPNSFDSSYWPEFVCLVLCCMTATAAQSSPEPGLFIHVEKATNHLVVLFVYANHPWT